MTDPRSQRGLRARRRRHHGGCVDGLATLERHDEALRQAAVADRIVLTKTDLPGAQAAAVGERLAAVNPRRAGARRRARRDRRRRRSSIADRTTPRPGIPTFGAWLAVEAVAAAADRTRPPVTATAEGVTTFCVVREEPVHAVTLALCSAALAENCGAACWRMKGIVHVAERPGMPGGDPRRAARVSTRPAGSPRWPDEDRPRASSSSRTAWIRSGWKPSSTPSTPRWRRCRRAQPRRQVDRPDGETDVKPTPKAALSWRRGARGGLPPRVVNNQEAQCSIY